MKSRKGQISIEFMLILLICIGYLHMLTATVIGPSIDAAEDITRLGQAKLSAEKLASAINEMGSSLGEGKRTLHLFVPKDSELGCTGTNVYFKVTLYGGEAPGCNDNGTGIFVCDQSIPVSSINSCSLSINTDGFDKGVFELVTIKKNSSGINVS